MGFTPKKKRVITLFKHRAAPEGKGGGHHQDQRNDEGGRPRVVVIPLGASIGWQLYLEHVGTTEMVNMERKNDGKIQHFSWENPL